MILTGNGGGRVASIDDNIAETTAGGNFAATYNRKRQMVLLAHPDSASVFKGWCGDADCLDGVVDMSRIKIVLPISVKPDLPYYKFAAIEINQELK